MVNLLQFLKNEGYKTVEFPHTGNEEVSLQIRDIITNEQLFDHLTISPISVQYFPYERQPYMECFSFEENVKVKLFKR